MDINISRRLPCYIYAMTDSLKHHGTILMLPRTTWNTHLCFKIILKPKCRLSRTSL